MNVIFAVLALPVCWIGLVGGTFCWLHAIGPFKGCKPGREKLGGGSVGRHLP